MALLDDVRNLEERVVARMKELEPLIAEYRQLEEIAGRLGLDERRATSAKRAPAKRDPRRRPAKARRVLAPAGQRREQVLAAIQKRPGVTVPEIAKSLGVDPTGLYRVVRGLQKEKLIKKDGTALTPA